MIFQALGHTNFDLPRRIHHRLLCTSTSHSFNTLYYSNNKAYTQDHREQNRLDHVDINHIIRTLLSIETRSCKPRQHLERQATMSFVFPSWETAFSPSFHEDAKKMLEGALNKVRTEFLILSEV